MQVKSNCALIGFSQEIRDLLIASYAVTLALGHTLKLMPTKADTMIRYLHAAEEISIPKRIINPSLHFMVNDPTSSRQSSKNLKDAKKYQTEKNR